LNIGGADWLYHRARIRQPLHALWVSSSSAVICLPLLTWTINVFLGVGLISWVLVSTFGATMFLWMYRNLLKVPSVQESRSGLLPLGSAQTPVPPSSSIKADWRSVTLGVAEQSENEDQQDSPTEQ
jgi:hypothetical protein